ncbi:metal-binding protein [Rhodocytophaga rosea]|uniref:Metal-binding protein n=1 Tax=Rhodocytophaga rosea TaxID=2704465 RepID=A0A6C0GHZ0_9BACT|nr:Ada metal-binding domain-containing protein [Rhodocytophaga rosea]QHT67434.1 metal-binding protein [Rhodocytophaga rosea]
MIRHSEIEDADLRLLLKQGQICLGGNSKLKIYGTLSCSSSKQMKRENRVFFTSEKEALQHQFRPCGHCMKQAYQLWKQTHGNTHL